MAAPRQTTRGPRRQVVDRGGRAAGASAGCREEQARAEAWARPMVARARTEVEAVGVRADLQPFGPKSKLRTAGEGPLEPRGVQSFGLWPATRLGL
eukprot:1039493-Alexandrium_andersonii.AAC.1